MCLQCVVEAQEFGELIPGIFVGRSTNDQAEDEWPNGYLGLIFINDPFIVFPIDITKSDFLDLFDQMWYPHVQHLLYLCEDVGYTRDMFEKDERSLPRWLFGHIQKFIENNWSKS